KLDTCKALASMAIELRQWDRAALFLRRAHDLRASDTSVLTSLGQVAAQRGEWSESVRWYQLWLSSNTAATAAERYTVYMAIGDARTHLGRNAGAAKAFSRALSVRPNDLVALLEKARALQKADRLDEAIATLRTALDVTPTGDLNAQIGLLYARQGRRQEALSYLERARELGVSATLSSAVFGQLGYLYAA